jgi:plastocyanin
MRCFGTFSGAVAARKRRRAGLLALAIALGLGLTGLGCNREPREVRLDLTIGSSATGGALRYQPAALYVPVGTRVAVTLYNRAPAPSEAHNFVLVQPGSVELVASLALTATALPGHVPSHEAVIASSPLLQPGEHATFRFMAPAPGAYEFLCSEPGLPPLLRGRFIVE